MTSQRESLLAQIKTDLSAINGTGSYTNTVQLVTRDLLSPSQIAVFPAIVMADESESELKTASTARLFYTLRLNLYCYLQAGPAVVSTALNSLLADVFYAMCATANRTHGGYAITTWYRGAETFTLEGRAISGFIASFDVNYTFGWDAP